MFKIFVNDMEIVPEVFKFPGGEIQVTLPENYVKGVKILYHNCDKFNISCVLKSSDDIMTLLLLNNALCQHGLYLDQLEIDYVPYARQDRNMNGYQAISIQVMADLINSLEAERVFIVDPHSDVTPALINNVQVVGLDTIINKMSSVDIIGDKTVVCPDAGAEKKILKLKKPYVMCTKKRNVETGEILKTVVYACKKDIEGKDFIIIDDICDGGRTFIEIAKVLRQKGAKTVDLFVTHGIFSKGMLVFDGLIDNIWTTDPLGNEFVRKVK